MTTQISSPFDVVSSFEEAEKKCNQDGARLYQPYTTASLKAILGMETEGTLTSYHPWHSGSETYFAIGMLTNYAIYPNHLYRDGESVDAFFFDNGLPYILGFLEYGNDTCVGMNGEDFYHIPCSGYSNFEKMIVSASTEHVGEDCFTYCNEQSGHCSWCGTEGVCCRKYYTGDGCDGLIGGEDKHLCVPKPGIVYSFKSS